MHFQRPGLSAQMVALVFSAGQTWWILTVDRFAPERFGPLFRELWQQILSCVMVEVIVLLAASARPGRTVTSELLCDATRSVLAGALLTFFAFQGLYFTERILLTARSTSSAATPWTKLLPEILYAWPFLSLWVMGITAGNSPIQGPLSSRPLGQ